MHPWKNRVSDSEPVLYTKALEHVWIDQKQQQKKKN